MCGWVSLPVLWDSLWPRGLQPTRLLCPWDCPGRNQSVDPHAFRKSTPQQAHRETMGGSEAGESVIVNNWDTIEVNRNEREKMVCLGFWLFFFNKTLYLYTTLAHTGFLGGSDGKESASNAGDARDEGLIPGLGSGRSHEGGNGNPF